MMRIQGILLLIMLSLGLTPSRAQAQLTDLLEVSGYLKELGQLSISNSLGTVRYDNILHHRIETEWNLSSHLEFKADMRTRVLTGYNIRHTPGLERRFESDPNFADLSWVWFDTESSLMHSNIDRLYGSYEKGPVEIHLGRQRINWGRSYVWNPNDLFNNYAFLDFDYEERPGVDAALVRYNWSYASSIEVGYRIADSMEETVIAAMVRFNTGTYDLQLAGGHYLDRATLGIGWAGYIGDTGFKGEVTYFHPEEAFFDETGVVTATAGLDYMFPSSLYLQTELLYNGGFQQQRGPLAELIRPPRADNLYIAETGYFVNASYPVHPLVNTSMALLGSFDRSIVIVIPQVTVSVSDSIDLLMLSQLLKGTVFNRVLETPNLLFFRLRWSY